MLWASLHYTRPNYKLKYQESSENKISIKQNDIHEQNQINHGIGQMKE